MQRNKVAIVSSCCDSTIHSVSKFHDIQLFTTFDELVEYVESTPDIFETIVVSENDLSFSATNMALLKDVIKSDFIQILDCCIYLVDETNVKLKEIKRYLDEQTDMNVMVYSGKITQAWIGDIVTGIARKANEKDIRVKTYRVRADEYAKLQSVKRYEDSNEHYVNDDDDLQDIPPESEPDYGYFTEQTKMNTYYVTGEHTYERTSMAYIIAQFLAQRGRTILIESDTSYHTLTDIALKTKVKQEIFYIEDFYDNALQFINKLQGTQRNLIIIGVRNKINFNRTFILDMIHHNCDPEFITSIVVEDDYLKLPYDCYKTVIVPNRVPDIIRMVDNIANVSHLKKVNFIAVQLGNLGGVNLSKPEVQEVLSTLCSYPIVNIDVVKLEGLNYKEGSYDLSSIIARAN